MPSRRPIRCVLLACTVASFGCHWEYAPQPAIELEPSPRLFPVPSNGRAIRYQPRLKSDARDPRQLQHAYEHLVREAIGVVSDARFRTRLGRIKALLVEPGGRSIPGSEILEDLDTAVLRITVEAPCDPYGASIASTGISATDGTICFGDDVKDRMLNIKNDDQQACALNTLIHEVTHAIPFAPGSASWKYMDEGHAGVLEPLVSYTTGAVAQCAYLERAEKPGGLKDDEFARCVQAAGTIGFASGCDAEWFERVIKPPPPPSETGNASPAVAPR